jgi:hypothetical protein
MAAAALAGFLPGCSPALDWREVHGDAGTVALFPCRPTKETRPVALAGARTAMTLRACQAAGVTYALAEAELGDPARIGPSLAQLKATLVGNIGGQVQTRRPFVLPGMTPSPHAERVDARGALPDGTPAQQSAAFFTRGTWIYQATAMGPQLDAEAVETFIGSLKFPP